MMISTIFVLIEGKSLYFGTTIYFFHDIYSGLK